MAAELQYEVAFDDMAEDRKWMNPSLFKHSARRHAGVSPKYTRQSTIEYVVPAASAESEMPERKPGSLVAASARRSGSPPRTAHTSHRRSNRASRAQSDVESASGPARSSSSGSSSGSVARASAAPVSGGSPRRSDTVGRGAAYWKTLRALDTLISAKSALSSSVASVDDAGRRSVARLLGASDSSPGAIAELVSDQSFAADAEAIVSGLPVPERRTLHLRDIILGVKKPKTYPLLLELAPSKRRGLECRVRLPDSYPDTPLANVLRSPENDPDAVGGRVASADLDFAETEESIESKFSGQLKWFPWNKARHDTPVEFAFLRGFHVDVIANKAAMAVALPAERLAFRGLGRVMLCAALRFAVQIGLIANLDSAYVVAQADGGSAFDADPRRAKELRGMSEDAQWLLLVRTLPFAAHKLLESGGRPGQTLADYILEVENNARLIDYYRATYGFRLLQSSASNWALIAATVPTILDHCAK